MRLLLHLTRKCILTKLKHPERLRSKEGLLFKKWLVHTLKAMDLSTSELLEKLHQVNFWKEALKTSSSLDVQCLDRLLWWPVKFFLPHAFWILYKKLKEVVPQPSPSKPSPISYSTTQEKNVLSLCNLLLLDGALLVILEALKPLELLIQRRNIFKCLSNSLEQSTNKKKGKNDYQSKF